MLIFAGIILNIIGIIGVIIPALPGVTLNYLALILLYINKGEEVVSLSTIIMFGLLTFLVALLDYILPLAGAKKSGTSRTGIIFAALGMMIGLFFFPPFGIFFGLLIGAFLGELIAGKTELQALKAGVVTFLGILTSMVIKLMLAVVMSVYYIWHLF
ncbi:MAG: DUF456 domain-containing protein [Atribacterota bacterium]